MQYGKFWRYVVYIGTGKHFLHGHAFLSTFFADFPGLQIETENQLCYNQGNNSGFAERNPSVTAKKGIVMERKNKRTHLSRAKIFFLMLLFAMGFTVNGLFCNYYNLYESSDRPAAIAACAIAENILINEDADDITSESDCYAETITKNPGPAAALAAISTEDSLLFFPIIVFLLFFLTLFLSLPDERTLINQKIRLND